MRMTIVRLQFIRLMHFIMVCITRGLPFATIIQPEGGLVSVSHGSLLISWDGKREVNWDKK